MHPSPWSSAFVTQGWTSGRSDGGFDAPGATDKSVRKPTSCEQMRTRIWRTGGTRPKRGSRLVFVLARASGRRRRGWLVVSEVSSPGDAGEAAVTLLLAIQEFVANGWRSGRQRQSAASPERAAVAVSVGVALAFQSDSLARLQQPAGWFRPRCRDCFASPDSASIALYGRFGVTSSCCASGIARIRSRARDRGR